MANEKPNAEIEEETLGVEALPGGLPEIWRALRPFNPALSAEFFDERRAGSRPGYNGRRRQSSSGNS